MSTWNQRKKLTQAGDILHDHNNDKGVFKLKTRHPYHTQVVLQFVVARYKWCAFLCIPYRVLYAETLYIYRFIGLMCQLQRAARKPDATSSWPPSPSTFCMGIYSLCQLFISHSVHMSSPFQPTPNQFLLKKLPPLQSPL